MAWTTLSKIKTTDGTVTQFSTTVNATYGQMSVFIPAGAFDLLSLYNSMSVNETRVFATISPTNVQLILKKESDNAFTIKANPDTGSRLCSWSGNPNFSRTILAFAFVYNSSTDKYSVMCFYPKGDPTLCNYSVNEDTTIDSRVRTILAGAIPPAHTWSPVTHLSGNNGQFYLPLSQIKAANIGDGETYTSTEDASAVILTNQSKIYNLLINIANNEETILAYCGGNYVTVTRQYVTGQQLNEITYVLKFYYRSGTLIYTTPQLAINDPPGTDYYLSFIIDTETQAAALDMILYLKSINKYGWNAESLPSDQDMYELYVWLQDNGQEHPIGTPYDTGSTDNGGEPNNPRPQDHITDSALPTTGGLNMGIITLYCPDDTELAAISSFLWSDDVLDNFKKYFNNFADNILCLYSLPFKPASLPTKVFTVGKVASQATALAAVDYCTTRYFDIDMGSVTLDSRWGSYLDYSPYTKIEIYLPYVGMHSLDIDEFMSPTKMDGTIPDVQGCIISLVYRLDIVTGLIVAKVKITSGGGVSNEIRYQFTGKVGSNIPLTGQTFSNLINGIVTAGAGLASTIATGGLTAPMSAAATVTATIQAQKPSVTSIGNISGDASMLATDVPYLRITSPNKPLLDDQQVFTGFPSYKSGTLTNFSGYTEVIDAHVEGISCTEEERAKILTYLKDGVII